MFHPQMDGASAGSVVQQAVLVQLSSAATIIYTTIAAATAAIGCHSHYPRV
jgi:hypothetical protein